MKKNLGTKDRIIRFIISLCLFFIAYWANNWIIFFAGAFVLYEACASWCILYQLLGKSTCDIDPKKH